jgi:O6-methylguanine-DNA--protein-cysteine methyltransferase
MSTFPGTTGQVVTSTMWNGLPAFEVQAAKTADYTAGSGDEYQQLIPMNKSSAANFNIPTDATYNFPIGTVITVLNIAANLVTIKAVTSGTTTVLSAGAVAAQPTLAQYKSAACIKTAANAWYIVGAIA